MKQQFNLKEYTKKDIEDAIATIKDGMVFNCKQMLINMETEEHYGDLNIKLYMQNLKLEKQLKQFENEKQKRIRHSNW